MEVPVSFLYHNLFSSIYMDSIGSLSETSG